MPRLDIKGPNLVKGIHLEGLRVLGKPERFARYYYENGADELIYMDVVASLYGRNSLLEFIKRTSKEIFIPLTVGGGLRTLEDIQQVLRVGADKVALNTAAIQNPHLVEEASRRFGSSTIIISIEAIKKTDGSYEAYIENGRQGTGVDPFEWAVYVAKKGAGEIMITSIDREGTGEGYDLELTRKIVESISIPVIACGGAGMLNHVRDIITQGKVDAVSISSLLHYDFVRNNEVKDDFSAEGNIEFIKDKRRFTKIHDINLTEIKAYLKNNNIECR